MGVKYIRFSLLSSISVTAEDAEAPSAAPQATMTRARAGMGGWVASCVGILCVWLFERHQDLPMKSQRIYIPGGTSRRRRVRGAEPAEGCVLPPSRLGVAVPPLPPPRPGCENQERELRRSEMRVAGSAGGE